MATPTVLATATGTAASGTTVSLTLPGSGQGVLEGDRLILALATSNTVTVPPAGWTAVANTEATPTVSGGRIYVWTKAATTGDLGASVGVTLAATARSALVAVATSPATVDATAVEVIGTNGASVSAPSVTAVTADGLLLTLHGVVINAVTVQATWTAPSGMTLAAEACSNNTSGSLRNSTLGIARLALTSSGATGAKAATATQTMQRAAMSIVLAGPSAPPEPELPVTVWDGSVELPVASVTVWDGSAEQPATAVEVAP